MKKLFKCYKEEYAITSGKYWGPYFGEGDLSAHEPFN